MANPISLTDLIVKPEPKIKRKPDWPFHPENLSLTERRYNNKRIKRIDRFLRWHHLTSLTGKKVVFAAANYAAMGCYLDDTSVPACVNDPIHGKPGPVHVKWDHKLKLWLYDGKYVGDMIKTVLIVGINNCDCHFNIIYN